MIDGRSKKINFLFQQFFFPTPLLPWRLECSVNVASALSKFVFGISFSIGFSQSLWECIFRTQGSLGNIPSYFIKKKKIIGFPNV